MSLPQNGWPDLSTIQESGCTVYGSAKNHPDSPKGKENVLKNRFRLPNDGFENIHFKDLYDLNQGKISDDGKRVIDHPNESDPNNQRAVSIVGYVKSVAYGGCSTGESCNCGTEVKPLCDAHITISQGPNMNTGGDRNIVVVEVTERSRELAKQGLLSNNNLGTDWTTPTLKSKLETHWARFSGWLFYDSDHVDQAWIIDPDNTVGRPNFRQTCWEVHPVMGIEVDVPKPADP